MEPVKVIPLLLSLLFVAFVVAEESESIDESSRLRRGLSPLTDEELSALVERSSRGSGGRSNPNRGGNSNPGRGRPAQLPGVGNAKKHLRDMEPEEFLANFGYVTLPPAGVGMDPGTRKEAIKKFQRMTGIPPTGRLDERTREQMTKPRCGMADSLPEETVLPPPGTGLDPGRQAVNFYVPGYKWNRTRLTYRIHNYSPDFAQGAQRRAFYDAFQHWSDVTPLTFNEVSGDADLNLRFRRGQHEDGPGNAFDGPDGVLAHAYYPMDGEVHYDEDELWTQYSTEGYNLMIVAAHEIGHALGLGHSNVWEALMAPYYAGYEENFALHNDDIMAIQSLYGRKVAPTNPPTTTTTTTRRPRVTTRRPRVTTRRPRVSTRRPRVTTPSPRPTTTRRPGAKPDPCTTKFDAMLQAGDYRVYVFRNQWVMRLNHWAIDYGYPLLARNEFQTPPINMGAAVYSWKTRYTYFFKGNKVWRYYGFQKENRTIIRSAGYPVGIQCAFMDRSGRIFLFKGSEYWIFDEARMNVASTRGRPIQAAFPGVPPNIEAAVRLRDGYLYFIKGYRYRKYDETKRRILPGYPKDKAGPWMGALCGGQYVPK